MTIDLDKLEKLARAAAEETGGATWKRERDWVEAIDSHDFVRPYAAAGRHILAANPAAVLELVERVRAAEGGLETIRSWSNATGGDAVDMQILAAETLFPGKFPMPVRLVEALHRAREATK